MTTDLSIVMLGSGGHARVLTDILALQGSQLLGYYDLQKNENYPHLYLGTDEHIDEPAIIQQIFVNGLGSINPQSLRMTLFERLKSRGARFATLVHPNAYVAPHVEVGEGSQIMAGAKIQTGVRIGSNAIINTGAIVDHDCVIEDHVHIAPGVTLSGGVRVQRASHVGTGAVVIQGISIATFALVGAGAVVIRDVPADTLVVGVPAIARHP